MTRVIIYARISTVKHNQSEERQIVELTNYAHRMGYTIVETLYDRCSGSNDDRESLNRILELASQNAFDKLLLSEISRLSRKTATIINFSEKMTTYRKSIFLMNYNLETLDKDYRPNPIANIILMVLGEMGKMETDTLKDRIKSSLQLCRAKGIKLGRKVGSTKAHEVFLTEQKAVVKLVKQGLSLRQISLLEGCSINTVRKVRMLVAT